LCGDVGGATAPEVRTDGEVSRVQPANQSQQTRPPLPPFTEETARQMVKMAEDAWNTRDPERVALAYTEDSEWRNRDEFSRAGRPSKTSLGASGLGCSTTG
jgi:hypothetical protein